jgi:hypothetical protein
MFQETFRAWQNGQEEVLFAADGNMFPAAGTGIKKKRELFPFELYPGHNYFFDVVFFYHFTDDIDCFTNDHCEISTQEGIGRFLSLQDGAVPIVGFLHYASENQGLSVFR